MIRISGKIVKRIVLASGMIFVFGVSLYFFAFTSIGIQMLLSPLDVGEHIPDDYGDVIIVFGGGMSGHDRLGTVSTERIKRACEIYNKRNRDFLISEGYLNDKEGFVRLAKEYLNRCSDSSIKPVFELNSRNTFQNCLNTSRLLDSTDYKEVIIVSSPYHHYRVNMILEAMIGSGYMIADMPNSEVYLNFTMSRKTRNFRFIFREYFAITKDWIGISFFNNL
jgi:uncharacterized SAM-binding protein YcdF (DUF218 family)